MLQKFRSRPAGSEAENFEAWRMTGKFQPHDFLRCFASNHSRFGRAAVLPGRNAIFCFRFRSGGLRFRVLHRRGGRVVYRTALEMRSVERHRGFESHPLRHLLTGSRFVQNRSDAVRPFRRSDANSGHCAWVL
jgi:hypothetical protein